MAQQILDTVGNTDTLKLGGQKINANFTELYGIALSAVQNAVLGIANGVATLDANGKVPAAQISSLQTTEVFPVASEIAMLALTVANTGDVAVRSDLIGSSSGNTFMLNGVYSNLVDWIPLDTGNITLPSQIGAEPALGNPPADNMSLVSSASGVRSFKNLGTTWTAHSVNATVSGSDGIVAKTQVSPGTGNVQLHMNGVHGSTTFTDNGTSNLVWTSVAGASIDTTSQKFGGASALFTAAGSINTPANPVFDFGSSGFTVDFQINPSALLAQDIMGQFPASGTTDASWMISMDSTGHIIFTSQGTLTPTITSSFTLTPATYQHVAICRIGTKLYMYLDGVQDTTTKNIMGTISASTGRLFNIGSAGITANTGFGGRLDEVRIHQGAGFWAQTFNSLTAATVDGTQIIGGSFTITLPPTPTMGDEIKFIDGDSYWNINKLIINGNGKTILNDPADFFADVKDSSFSLIYDGAGWKLF